MISAKVTNEHRWLQRMIGDWNCEGEMSAGQPEFKWTAEESVRPIGGYWVQCEARGKMPDGAPSLMQMTLGHDPVNGRFTGTFIGSMMTHLWIYQGSLDSATDTLTLDTEGPDMSVEGRLCRYQDIIQWHSPDHRTLASRVQQPDGSWQPFMLAHYRRT